MSANRGKSNRVMKMNDVQAVPYPDRRITVGSTGGAAALKNVPSPAKDSDTATYQVEANLSQLARLEAAYDGLVKKLAPVLPVYPADTCVAKVGEPNPCTTRLAQDIWSQGHRIWELAGKIEALTAEVKI